MKELGYGSEYRYAHNEEDAIAYGERYFPEDMPEQTYYHPVARGLELKIGEKLAAIKKRNQSRTKPLADEEP
jgi:putative ATPase